MLGPARTKEEQRRIELMHERGCVPCYLEHQKRGRPFIPEPGDVHHVAQGDHSQTYINCPWHHRALPKSGLTPREMDVIFGPSMARSPGEYRERYGTEAEILALQGSMLLKSATELAGV